MGRKGAGRRGGRARPKRGAAVMGADCTASAGPSRRHFLHSPAERVKTYPHTVQKTIHRARPCFSCGFLPLCRDWPQDCPQIDGVRSMTHDNLCRRRLRHVSRNRICRVAGVTTASDAWRRASPPAGLQAVTMAYAQAPVRWSRHS